MVAESRRPAVPAAVDPLLTSATQEDDVSMGGARRTSSAPRWPASSGSWPSSSCVRRTLDVRGPLEAGRGTGAALAAVGRAGPPAGRNRYALPELAAVEALIAGGAVLDAVQARIGPLQ